MKRKYQKTIKNADTLLSEEINKLSSILQISLDNLYFIYHGKSLNNTKKKSLILKALIY